MFGLAESAWEGGQETAWDWVTERTFGTADSGKMDKKLHGIL